MDRKIHKVYDVIMKIIILTYLIEFLKYIGEERNISEILQTEITTLNGRTKYLDFLCRLDDDTLCHVEFQFPVAYAKDLSRFFNYNITSEIRYEKTTDTIIFNFTAANRGEDELSIGESKDFHPKIFYLGNIDFEKEIEKINIKLNLNQLEKIINGKRTEIKLTYKEELHLLLMSLAPKYKNKRKLLKYVIGLFENERLFHNEKLDTIKSIIQLEIDNLLDEYDLKYFKGAIKMNNETEKIIKKAVDDVNKKYEQEALYEAEQKGLKKGKEDGFKKGKEDAKKEIAKKLKGLHTPEQIAKITGLSLNTIMLL